MDSWCRLCAKIDGNDIHLFFKMESTSDVSHLVEKYFNISIQSQDNLPSKICKECFTYMWNLDRFANQCVRVERMYAELSSTDEFDEIKDIEIVRCKYGVNQIATTTSSLMDTNTEQIDEKTATNVKDECTEYKPINSKKRPSRHRAVKVKQIPLEPLVNVTIKEERDEDTQGFVRQPDVVDLNDDNGAEPFNNTSSDEDALDINKMSKELKTLVSADEPMSSSDSDDDYAKPSKKRQKKIPTEYIDCPECDKVLTSKRSYSSHLRHSHKDKLPFGCATCPKRFITEIQAALHERSHLPPEDRQKFPCPICKKQFLTSISIQLHIQSVHNTDRSFICEECGKSFSTNHSMKDHMLVHSDDHPCQCRYCPKKFKNDYRLKVHEDTHNNTAYVCPECGLSLNTKRTLRRHMIVHSDVKKYKCQYCEKEYKRAKSLKIHLILHTGMHPYKCPFCDRTFADGSNCRSHKKKAHPEELAAFEAAGNVHQTTLPKLSMLLMQASESKSALTQ